MYWKLTHKLAAPSHFWRTLAFRLTADYEDGLGDEWS
jgi:hypothetical protein